MRQAWHRIDLKTILCEWFRLAFAGQWSKIPTVQGGAKIYSQLKGTVCLLSAFFLFACKSNDPTDWRTPLENDLTKTKLKDLRERANQNDYFAMTHLGWRYDTGTGVKQDLREAATWYRLAAEDGHHSMAQNNLGCLYRDGRGVIQDYKTAAILFLHAADQGNRHAKTNLGWLFERGYGVPRNYPEAFRLYTEAAAERRDFKKTGQPVPGHPMAQNNLGRLYLDGKGLRRPDPHEAFKLFTKAADAGNHHALHNLGIMYERGLAVKLDIRRALVYYDQAMQKGNVYSITAIACIFEEGKGVPKNYELAKNYYESAIKKGSTMAMFNLANMKHRGRGMKEDNIGASDLMRSAAERGNAFAQASFAEMLEKGIGVPQDFAKAAHWYEQAAKQGLAVHDWLDVHLLIACRHQTNLPQRGSIRKRHGQLEKKPIELGLGQRIGPLHFNRILRRNDHKWLLENHTLTGDRHRVFLHGFKKRRLCLGSRPIDLIGQHHMSKHWPATKCEFLSAARVMDKSLSTRNVCGHEVGCKLNPRVAQLQRTGQGLYQQGLAQSRLPLQ